MDISKKKFDIQKRLFEEIQKSLPSQYALVDIVSDVLNISMDAAYRRMRYVKLLDIEEVSALCAHFQISFDRLMNVRNIHQFDCIYRPINFSMPGDYLNYVHALSKNIEQLKTADDSSLLMSATDIPVFHLISQNELTFFKLFTWAHSVYNYEGTFDDFLKEIEMPEISGCFQKISRDYEIVPSSEIWTEDTVNTTLRLISYYDEICMFPNLDFPVLLCEQVLNILEKLQQWAENSCKGKNSTPFQLYVSEMDPENSYLLMKQSGQTNCLIKLYTINSLNVLDQAFCRETEQWLTKLAKRSVPLCGNSEKERIKFFNAQKQKVRLLIGKIKDSF